MKGVTNFVSDRAIVTLEEVSHFVVEQVHIPIYGVQYPGSKILAYISDLNTDSLKELKFGVYLSRGIILMIWCLRVHQTRAMVQGIFLLYSVKFQLFPYFIGTRYLYLLLVLGNSVLVVSAEGPHVLYGYERVVATISWEGHFSEQLLADAILNLFL